MPTPVGSPLRADLRADLRNADGRDHGLAVGFVILACLVLADLLTGVVLTASYASAVVVAALITTPQRTALLALATLTLSAGSGLWHDSFGSRDWTVRCALALLLSSVAVAASQISTSREQRLAAMTRIADVVQRALLRPIPPQLGQVAVATRYRSATEAAAIGGDLYEAALTPHGVRVLLGDVRGKGIEAAETAATVLGAFRNSAHQSPNLTTLAEHLDRAVSLVIDDEDFVTAVLVEVDGDRLRVASCGHHPPLLVGDAGSAAELPSGEPSPPLGLQPSPEVREHRFPEGARVLLYTDGLIEARDREGRFFDVLPTAPELADGTLEEALDVLVRRLERHAGGHLDDDIALVLLENLGVAPVPQVRSSLTAPRG